MLDWQTLIDERNEWVAHNFPDNKLPKPQESVLGMIEELGELSHSHLKELQKIRGTDEEHQALAKDAIGDVTVYLLGVLNESCYCPKWDLPETIPDKPEVCIFNAVGFLGWIALKSFIGRYDRRFELNVDAFCGELDAYCLHRGWNYEQIVTETWNKVKQRDWIANPQDGNEDSIDLDNPALELDQDSMLGREVPDSVSGRRDPQPEQYGIDVHGEIDRPYYGE